MRFNKHTFLLIVSISFLLPVFGQPVSKDSLQNKLDTYLSETPFFKLYLHLDKNNYTPNDTIWFKAYALSNLENKVLFVRLADQNKNIVLQKQFPVYDIRSHGELELPDTLQEGKYLLYAYTDQMISSNDMHVFVQPVSVSKNVQNRIEAKASVLNKGMLHTGDKVSILVKVDNAYDRNLKGQYQLMTGTTVLKKGKISTNKMGEATLHFTYPDLTTYETLRCVIQLREGTDIADLNLNLRHDNPRIQTTVYPEGGHLIAGADNNLLLVTNDEANIPVSCQLRIKKGQEIIQQTTTDKNGLGNLVFKPESGSFYTIETMLDDSVQQTDFPCPIEQQGYSMRVNRNKSQSSVVLRNLGFPDSVQLVLRTTDSILWMQPLQIANGDSLVVPLPLNQFPDFACNLILMDQHGNPFCDRLLANASGKKNRVSIEIKRNLKDGFNQCTAELKVTDSNDLPRVANLSVSIVEKSSLNLHTYRTLPTTFQLIGLTNLPACLDEWTETTTEALMLMNDPGRYSWKYVENFKKKGYVRFLNNAGGVNGRVVSIYNLPVKLRELQLQTQSASDKDKIASTLKSLNQAVNPAFNGSFNLNKVAYSVIEKIQTIPVSEDGSFHIAPQNIITENNQENSVQLGPYFSHDYRLEIYNLPAEYDDILCLSNALVFPESYNLMSQYTPPVQRTLNKDILLKEVRVEAKGRTEFERNLGKKEDYVCREYNVFNCANHRTGYKPQRGWVYSSGEKGFPFLYHGPGRYFTPAPEGSAPGYHIYEAVSGITKPTTFYLPGTKDKNTLLTDSRSTLYWAPNLFTDAQGTSKIEFYTSNRKAEFVLIVQGLDVENNQPVFGMQTFSF